MIVTDPARQISFPGQGTVQDTFNALNSPPAGLHMRPAAGRRFTDTSTTSAPSAGARTARRIGSLRGEHIRGFSSILPSEMPSATFRENVAADELLAKLSFA